MNNSEARFILGAYRPGGADAGDPAFAEALGQARLDPGLGTWLERSQAHDAAIAAKVRALAPPPGLREAIMAGARASAVPRPVWRRPAGLAMAAGLALLLALAVGRLGRPAGGETAPAAFARFALGDLRTGRHGGHGAEVDTLQRWLAADGHRLGSGGVPIDFDRLQATGCRTLSFRGRPLVEICFPRGGSEFHLYVMRRRDLPEIAPRADPVTVADGGEAAAVWGDEDFSYAVVGAGGVAALRGLL